MDTTSHPSEPIHNSPSDPIHRRSGCRSVGALYIAATVFGFIVFWPLGLALLVWAIWGHRIKRSRLARRVAGTQMPDASSFQSMMSRRPSNSALAEYLEREQQRLRTEQEKLDEVVRAFEAFKDAERRSNDQRDFDAFLKRREEDKGQ